MIQYKDAINLLPNANYIYADVTISEIEAVNAHVYMTEIDGILILGTTEQVEALAAKELVSGPMKF